MTGAPNKSDKGHPLERQGTPTATRDTHWRPVVLDTSLNRRGEPIACTPTDALDIFEGADLRYLMLEDLLVTKAGSGDDD